MLRVTVQSVTRSGLTTFYPMFGMISEFNATFMVCKEAKWHYALPFTDKLASTGSGRKVINELGLNELKATSLPHPQKAGIPEVWILECDSCGRYSTAPSWSATTGGLS